LKAVRIFITRYLQVIFARKYPNPPLANQRASAPTESSHAELSETTLIRSALIFANASPPSFPKIRPPTREHAGR
jgi:hypothetical protein